MTPKEKAIELVDKFYQTTPNECFVNEPIGIAGRYKAWNQSKQCALIAVDEILNGYEFDSLDIKHKRIMDNINYWDKVKQEIENL
jgi:hypothetical protein